jgi:hypothetical protein
MDMCRLEDAKLHHDPSYLSLALLQTFVVSRTPDKTARSVLHSLVGVRHRSQGRRRDRVYPLQACPVNQDLLFWRNTSLWKNDGIANSVRTSLPPMLVIIVINNNTTLLPRPTFSRS